MTNQPQTERFTMVLVSIHSCTCLALPNWPKGKWQRHWLPVSTSACHSLARPHTSVRVRMGFGRDTLTTLRTANVKDMM